MKSHLQPFAILLGFARLPASLMAPTLAALGLILVLSAPTPSFAADSGSSVGVSGTCQMICTDPGTNCGGSQPRATFRVRMPDGSSVEGFCQDRGWPLPRDGSYSFTGSWDRSRSAYRISVASSYVTSDKSDLHPWNLPYIVGPPPYKTQAVGDFWWNPNGGIRILKGSSNPSISDGSPCYSLAGAQYAVFSDGGLTRRVGTITTDAWGRGGLDNIPVGTYYLKETVPAKGYALDESVYPVTVNGGATATANVSDAPQNDPAYMLVSKIDAETGKASPQGAGTLGGAQFTVRYYAGLYTEKSLPQTPTRSWVFRTDESGYTRLATDYLVSGDPLYSAHGIPILPLGTVTVQETKAPAGYLLTDTSLHLQQITSEGTAETVETFVEPDLEHPTVREQAVRGGIGVRKRDIETDAVGPQGAATFEGASFTIRNISDGAVMVDGTSFESGQDVKTIVTAADGCAATSATELPYGDYEVRETRAPAGYILNESWRKTVKIRENGRIYRLEDETGHKKEGSKSTSADPEQVIRGGAEVRKRDMETDSTSPEGGATFRGAEFTIRYVTPDGREVLVDDRPFKTGEDVKAMTANDDGVAKTASDCLPYGDYEVRETRAPDGYNLNPIWRKTIRVREDGRIYRLEDETGRDPAGAVPTSADPEHVKRGDVRFNKVAGDSMEGMARVPFLVTSASDKERHVVVTDENGSIDTSASWIPHTRRTNASDSALKGDEVADESRLDPGAGVWFTGYPADSPDHRRSVPDDSLGALPYDTYEFRELRASGNAGHNLVTFTVTVTRDRVIIDRGTIDDSPIDISTEEVSAANGSHEVDAGPVSLVDTVSYEGARPGRTYRVEGALMDGQLDEPVRDAAGDPITARAVFTAKKTRGKVKITFRDVDASAMGGVRLVAYERLYQGDDLVASEEDPDAAKQTVTVRATISTRAFDADGRGSHVAPERSAHVVDTVSYKGLAPGRKYVLEGKLVKRSDESVIRETSLSFTPAEPFGQVAVDFDLDASALGGEQAVAYETLRLDGVEVASHRSLDDKSQTVTFPKIETDAAVDKARYLPAEGERTIVDTVGYEGLLKGRRYTIDGALLLAASGEPVRDADGRPITASTDFEPSASSGSIENRFTLDAKRAAGERIVVAETLGCDGVEICAHRDLDDERQTIGAPRITTAASDGAGSHLLASGKQTKIEDVVSYRGVLPGHRYRLRATLIDRESGDEIMDAKGDPVSGKADFTAESSEGEQRVTLTLDTTAEGVLGHRLVVFERLEEDGVELASHTDLDDEDQTIGVPIVSTSARSGSGDRHCDAKKGARIIDTLSYRGLIPGLTYRVIGSLMSAQTGEALPGSEGRPCISTLDLVPERADGEIDVPFEIDASALGGTDVVVYEAVEFDGREVASHRDLADADQTVSIVPEIITSARTGDGGAREADPESGVQIVDTVRIEGATPGMSYDLTADAVVKSTGETVELDQSVHPSAPRGDAEAVGQNATGADAKAVWPGMLDGIAQAMRQDATGTLTRLEDEPAGALNAAAGTALPPAELAALLRGHAAELAGIGIGDGALGEITGALDRAAGAPAGMSAYEVVGNGRVRFTASAARLDVPVPVVIDAGRLAGTDVVMFETMARSSDGREVASHRDADDAEQTIHISGTPLDQTGEPAWPLLLAGAGAALAAALAVSGAARRRRRGRESRSDERAAG